MPGNSLYDSETISDRYRKHTHTEFYDGVNIRGRTEKLLIRALFRYARTICKKDMHDMQERRYARYDKHDMQERFESKQAGQGRLDIPRQN